MSKIKARDNGTSVYPKTTIKDVYLNDSENETLESALGDTTIVIEEDDIVLDLTGNIYDYDAHGIQTGFDIDSENLSVIAKSGYAVTGIIPLMAGCEGTYQLYINGANANAMKVLLYNGSTPVASYYYSSQATNYENVIVLLKENISKLGVNGIRVASSYSGTSYKNWYFARSPKYVIKDDSKRSAIKRNGIDLRYFPRMAEETDDAPRFRRALKVAMWGGTVHVPDGEYVFNSSVYVDQLQSIIMSNGAMIKAGITFSGYIFSYHGCNQFCSLVYGANASTVGNTNGKIYLPDGDIFIATPEISGGSIDCCGMCDGAIAATGFHGYVIRNIGIANPKSNGIYLHRTAYATYEAILSKIRVETTMTGLSGNIGIYAHITDSHFSDIIVVDCTIGFKSDNGTANIWERCHHWNGPIEDSLSNSISFDTGGDRIIAGYSDTAVTGYKVNNAILIGCIAFWNSYFPVPEGQTRKVIDGTATQIGCRL